MYARKVRGDAREQHRVVHAAAAGEDAARAGLVCAQRVRDGSGGELEQRGLHVLGAFVTGQLRGDPGEVEVFATAAFRRRQGEPRFGAQALEQRGVDGSAGGECAVRIERRAVVAFAPRIHQGVRGAGVEATHVAVRRQQREVGDAAEVEHGAVFARVVQHRSVEGGHERRALAAGRDIAAAEVGDGVDAGAFGDDVAVAELPGEGMPRRGAMAHRLAMSD